jgi:hypothetical protein
MSKEEDDDDDVDNLEIELAGVVMEMGDGPIVLNGVVEINSL